MLFLTFCSVAWNKKWRFSPCICCCYRTLYLL